MAEEYRENQIPQLQQEKGENRIEQLQQWMKTRSRLLVQTTSRVWAQQRTPQSWVRQGEGMPLQLQLTPALPPLTVPRPLHVAPLYPQTLSYHHNHRQ